MKTPQKPTNVSQHSVRGSWRMNRRTLLRGLGVSMALPLLDIMEAPRALAAAAQGPAAQPPVRLGYLYFPNGSAEGSWKPRKVDNNRRLVQLNEWMSPLEPYKQDLIIPSNLWTPEGNGHIEGAATWLTGGGYNRRTVDAGGTSIDQIAARTIGKDNVMPSLELSLRGEGNFSKDLPRNNMSWSNGKTPLHREIEPRVIFDHMFLNRQGGVVDGSVLDRVANNAKDLKRNASTADQRKIDEYLESVRAIERRIEFADQVSKQAGRDRALTDTLARPAAGIPIEHQAYMRLMLDLMAMAWWADATRVASFMLDHGQSNRYFNFVPGVKGTWHALSHWRDFSGKTEDDDGVTKWDSRGSKLSMYNKVTRWHHEQFAYLLKRLHELEEDGEPLINRCVLLYGSSLADGHEHGDEDLPLIVAGHGSMPGQAKMQTGKYFRYKRPTSLNRLHLSIAQRAGVPITRFAETDSPLSIV
ncbi:MAG: DUF1552 domain-containing protein [Planctomycetota bacterium]